MGIDFLIDELENKVAILERKIGITLENEPAAPVPGDNNQQA